MPLPPLVAPGPPLTSTQKQRFSRHLLLPQLGEIGQRRLLASRVLVVGAGGLGSPILLYLAAAGVGHLGIIDDDVVEESNLQRQVVHGIADVGRSKVESAAERIAELNPDVTLTLHDVRLTPQNATKILSEYDLVLDGTDNFPTRYLVDDTCTELGLPLIWGSILRFDAQVSLFWAPHGPTLRDLFPHPPPKGATPSCGEAGVLGAMCGQVGSLMAAEAVKLVAGIGEPLLGRVAVLDVLSARWSEIPLQARTNQPQPAGVVPQALASVPTITARELATRLTTRDAQQDSFVLLDVRESGERDIAVIPGAIHIPLGQVLADPTTIVQRLRAAATVGNGGDPIGGDPVRGSSKRNSLPLDVVVHCLSGPRSDRAAAALLAAGVHAVNLEGGIRAWATDVDPSLATY